jgi:plasmid stabilization system protein ParE
MPRVIVSAGAARGLARCPLSLSDNHPLSLRRAADVIKRHFAVLASRPDVGRPWPDLPELRELVIAFGDTGYVASYRYNPERDALVILAFRNQREAGY